ncbi:AAA family ATPase [Nostoc sp. PA-18-2419]|uniref:ATP-binding sensor histidine kinase n=1 Tax=Nostoc sp. PA-18-2419 TaxID=2575443 RepID=UPI001108863F|nr:AAA family ATPase [Nostoc sp. PA-18-2419]
MNIAIEPNAKLLNYQITEQLYTSFRTLVYRAIREEDRLPVIIKLLQQEYPTSFSELLHLSNHYTIAKNLDLPNIVRPYSLEPYGNSYALVMEDFGGISLREWMKAAIESNPNLLEEFLDIAIALSEILDGLYRHRTIHKDITPANILINPQTKQVKLTDFSIASLLPRETQEIQHPNVLEGTLVYLSPEQTGRMNRQIDYRCDYYSLGITFYELLTGQLPFQSDDPMELVYSHIAKQPPSLWEVKSQKSKAASALGGFGDLKQLAFKSEEIPKILCDMTMKLMAKNAEERYQSALGLKHDLEVCRRQLQETGRIETFVLSKQDICDRFIIPEKLYGRQAEVETLLSAFERVSQGSTEIILLAGCSGIGKTSVVNEVQKPIVRQRGYFIKGKFNQFCRHIPFAVFVQVFRDLMTQLLGESYTQLEQWKPKLLKALGENAQLIIEVIPELESLIGKQPPAPELSASAAENRFNLLFLKLTQVFAAPEHPLVIFIDDLQWVDSASLKLIQLLTSEADIGHLLLIGAYRENEVKNTHPLLLTLDEIQKLGAIVNTIILNPLDEISLNHLVADTLNCSLELATPLTDFILSKTKGNPFFCTQFLKALHQNQLIIFNPRYNGKDPRNANKESQGWWECDIAQVQALSFTDDVVEFMAIQLQKLPKQTQEVLKLAACIGNQFDLMTLAIVYKKSQLETVADLWQAVEDGLIIPINEVYKFYHNSSLVTSHLQRANNRGQMTTYKFFHDRVQQAAYSLIPDLEKQALSMSKSATSSSNASFMLDMTTVLKAFQSLSSEIELDKLLNTLLCIVIENTGADKCVLLLLKENRLVVEAIAQIGQQSTILQSIPIEDSTDVPRSLIYAVKCNLQPSVIIDTPMYSTPIADPYIMRQQPKSLLCMPILHQEKLLGILYLENNLNTAAFTSERVEILNLLCTQVAISLENARVNQQVQDTLKNLGQTEQFLQLIIDNIPQSIFWKDRNSFYLWCNRNFAKAAGLKLPENIVGKNDYELPWTEEESDWYIECDRRIMESGQAELNIIETSQQADGKQIWANTNKIPLRDKEGNVLGILGTIEDITERQEAEQLLQQQKQQLEQALQELQIMQLQLVQSEKMSALGNLVAGVAHEINNPIGFIAGNIEPAKDYVKELFGLIDLYQEKFPHPGLEIEDEINAMDLNYLREDLPKLLDSMRLGVSRIRSISNSLRNFSRADQDYKVPFDIHEGIDSTILILRHRLKANQNRPGIEIVKDYGKLPLVECFAGQLNQVFMNLLANAIDALEEYNIGRSLDEILANPNCITIKTSIAADSNHVLIKIADNGVGMSSEVKQKVFDHLFTTKPVGKGTGFGLAIARQIIVEGHGGLLSCYSEPGEGTEFIIQISS